MTRPVASVIAPTLICPGSTATATARSADDEKPLVTAMAMSIVVVTRVCADANDDSSMASRT